MQPPVMSSSNAMKHTDKTNPTTKTSETEKQFKKELPCIYTKPIFHCHKYNVLL